MSVGSVSASNGMFYIKDASGKPQQCDLGTLMMMLNLDRTKNLDEQIALQLADIQDRNKLIGQLTEIMSWARSRKAEGKDDDLTAWNKKTGVKTWDLVTVQGESKKIQEAGGWAETLGLTWSDIKGTRPKDKDEAAKWDATWDANINNIKSKIDMLNNDSQMDNIKLQNLLEKRNNAFEMATKVMDTNNQSVQSTLRNL